MLILIFAIFIIAMVISIIFMVRNGNLKNDNYYTKYDLYSSLTIVFAIISCIFLIAICCITPKVATASTIDAKIEMYEQENAKIEQSIDEIVDNYMKYEKETYDEFKSESAITLVSMIPELKADELVMQQIKTYTNNNNVIKGLKEQKIDMAKTKWILYFGK